MADIRRSPVEGQVVYPIIFGVSAPSQVVQDFSHQQYLKYSEYIQTY